MRALGVLAFVALVAATAQASLMAVDLGGEFLKVAVVKAGRTPISVVINEMSRRKTPAVVGFLGEDRILGEAAVTMTGRHPGQVFSYLRELLGKPATHADVQRMVEENNLNYDIVEDPVRKSVRIRMPDSGLEYSIEEMVASVLTYALQIAKSHAGVEIKDTVLLIPPFFSPAQRQALLDSAELAGLNVLSLMHSYSAAALQYGIERDFENRTEHVVIYDVGATAVSAALVTFSAYPYKDAGKTKYLSQFEVRDVAWREGAGALRLDLLLKKHFAAAFVAKYGTEDVLKVPKAVAKMSKPVRQTKEMLSANVDAPFNVEELHDGKDFSTSISRAEFEALAGDFWDGMKQPLQELVQRNNLTADDFTVQLVGGGSRVPRVQAELSSVLEGVRLEKNLDADEAVVLGGGLYAANKSTMFRLRKFGMNDGHVFPVTITLDDIEAGGIPEQHHKFGADQGGEALLPYMKSLDTKRKVTLTETTADPLRFSLHLSGDRLPCCLTSKKLVSYAVTGLKGVLERYNQTGKVQLHFVGNSNGLVYLQKADATVEFIENVEVEKEVPDDGSGDTEAASDDAVENETDADDSNDDEKSDAEKAKDAAKEKKEKAAKDKKEKKEKKEDAKDKKEKDAKGGKDDKDAKDDKPKPKMKKIKVMKRVKRTRVVQLEVSETVRHDVPPMTDEEKAASKKKLKALRKKELAKQESARAKNELEAYIIDMHGKLEDNEDIISVTTEEQRAKLASELTAAEDWLYMDEAADEAAAKVYNDRLRELKALGSPMEDRVYEMQRREERVAGAVKLVEIIGMATNSWLETKPYINATEIEALQTMADGFDKWVKEKVAEQEKTPAHEEPAFKVDDLTSRMEVIHYAFKRLQNIKAPKPPPPPPAPPSPPANDTDSSEQASANSTDAGSKDSKQDSADIKDELRR